MEAVFEDLTESDHNLIGFLMEKVDSVESEMDSGRIKKNLTEINTIIGHINKFISHEAPWSLKGEKSSKKRRVIFTSVFLLAQINRILTPILFKYSEVFRTHFGLGENEPKDLKEFAKKVKIPGPVESKKENSPLFRPKITEKEK